MVGVRQIVFELVVIQADIPLALVTDIGAQFTGGGTQVLGLDFPTLRARSRTVGVSTPNVGIEHRVGLGFVQTAVLAEFGGCDRRRRDADFNRAVGTGQFLCALLLCE